jgi:Protein of unknown function (DUF3455)
VRELQGAVHLHNLSQRKKEKEVNLNYSNKFLDRVAARILRGSLATLAILAVSGMAYAQEKAQEKKEGSNFGSIPSPTTPERITPPEGNSAFLLGHGVGTQGYVCLPTIAGGASWTVNSARPEATLFTHIFGEPVQIITHFLSPVVNPNDSGPKPPRFGDATWQSSFDSSRVWAQKQNFVTAGTDVSCPNSGAIDCLLLQVIGSDEGPAGGRSLTRTTFIQRLNTAGGSAPAAGCQVAGDVGKQALVPYRADYFFFRNDQ